MKNIQNKLIAFLFMALAFSNVGFSQGNLASELQFEVNRIYPHISITKAALNEANKLADLNSHYESSWIKTYISVEVSTIYQGETITSVSKNDVLSQEQKDRMSMSDSGTDVSVKVKYIPQNTLTKNDPKELNFTIVIDPENDAKFPGEQQQLIQYLKEKAIDKIPDTSFENYDLVVIQFTINEEGEVTNPHVFNAGHQTFNDDKIEHLLLETIRNMPCWKPAEYADGTTVKQDFALTVGNMENCVVHLLNIQRNGISSK